MDRKESLKCGELRDELFTQCVYCMYGKFQFPFSSFTLPHAKPKSPIATVKFSSFPQKILYSTKVGFGSQIIGSAKKDIFVFLFNRICNLHFCIFAVRAFVRSFFCFCSSVRVLSAVRSEAVRRRNFFAVRSFIHSSFVGEDAKQTLAFERAESLH